MNRKQLALSAVLIAFLAQEAYAIYLYGYLGFFRIMVANFASFTAMVDLIIALILIVVWMGEDAEERKVFALPFLLLTLALGSVGPLLYLIRRFGDRTKHDVTGAARTPQLTQPRCCALATALLQPTQAARYMTVGHDEVGVHGSATHLRGDVARRPQSFCEPHNINGTSD